MEARVGPGLSRRQVIAAAGLVGLAAGVPALRRMALPSIFRRVGDAEAVTHDHLTLARFTPHVGTRFTAAAAGGGRVALTLDEAAARRPNPADRPGLQGESFSLLFQATGPRRIAKGTQMLVHPTLGAFPLFLVAVGRDGDRQDYHAVVDRRTPPDR